MNQTKQTNRKFVLNSRPRGAPVPENFRLENTPTPTPGNGEVLLRTVYLSLDPYMRGRMNDAPSYAPPVALGEVMVGGTVSRVVESQHPGFSAGDWVLSYNGWQDYCISDGTGLIPLGTHWSTHHWRWACWGCRGSPPIWDCLISANRNRARPSSWRPQPGRSGRTWDRSPS